MSTPVQITVSGVLEDLQNGYTRTKADKQYQGDGKSIQEKYGLNKSDVSRLFQNEKLKGRKTIGARPPAFVLTDDTTSETDIPDPVEPEEEPISAGTQKASEASTGTEEPSSEEDPDWMEGESS